MRTARRCRVLLHPEAGDHDADLLYAFVAKRLDRAAASYPPHADLLTGAANR